MTKLTFKDFFEVQNEGCLALCMASMYFTELATKYQLALKENVDTIIRFLRPSISTQLHQDEMLMWIADTVRESDGYNELVMVVGDKAAYELVDLRAVQLLRMMRDAV